MFSDPWRATHCRRESRTVLAHSPTRSVNGHIVISASPLAAPEFGPGRERLGSRQSEIGGCNCSATAKSDHPACRESPPVPAGSGRINLPQLAAPQLVDSEVSLLHTNSEPLELARQVDPDVGVQAVLSFDWKFLSPTMLTLSRSMSSTWF